MRRKCTFLKICCVCANLKASLSIYLSIYIYTLRVVPNIFRDKYNFLKWHLCLKIAKILVSIQDGLMKPLYETKFGYLDWILLAGTFVSYRVIGLSAIAFRMNFLTVARRWHTTTVTRKRSGYIVHFLSAWREFRLSAEASYKETGRHLYTILCLCCWQITWAGYGWNYVSREPKGRMAFVKYRQWLLTKRIWL